MLTDTQLRSEHGLSRTQFEALQRSVEQTGRFGEQWVNEPLPRLRHPQNGLSYGAASSSIRVLSNNGYITLELVHSREEQEALRTQQREAVAEARDLLATGAWESALASLNQASKLKAAIDTRRWKLTDKALQVVALASR